MERVTHYRPRVSRETRLLVTTALLAVLALWMLARLRFPAPPAEPRAISGILSSLGTGTDFDGLATQVARVRAIVGPYLVPLEFEFASSAGTSSATRPGLRIGGDVAVAHIPPNAHLRGSNGISLVSYDAASQLALVRLPLDTASTSSAPRTARIQPPQYVVTSAVYPEGVTLRPAFVAATAASEAPLWSSVAWVMPPDPNLPPGSFLFTRNGEFAGMTITHRGTLAFVSGETVLDEANRLIARAGTSAADYAIQIESLTPALRRVLGASAGVVVTWVDPNGPAKDALIVGDIIESANGQPMTSSEHWQRHLAGVVAGAKSTMIVRRAGASRTLTVDLAARPGPDDHDASAARATFGATTRVVRGLGSEVTAIAAGSLAARSGLLVGDLITFVGSASMPSPAQLADVTSSLREGQSVLLGVRRRDEHRLLVLER